MKAKTEELLYMLLWTCDLAMRPTFRNLTDSFEAWSYRNGFHRQLAQLEKRRMLEAREKADQRVLRLTDAGRLRALGGRDPVACWESDWDGQWWMVLFDLRAEQEAERRRLRRYLRGRGLGCLQKSVWITPHPLEAETDFLADTKVNPSSILFLNARPASGESDADIVAAAWDFDRINAEWRTYRSILKEKPTGALRDAEEAGRFHHWARRERQAWLNAVAVDPLLPRALWPAGYAGESAWLARVKAHAAAVRQVAGTRGIEVPNQ